MAEQLIASLSAEFDPSKYNDEYREQVLELIENKAAGEEIAVQPEAEEPEAAPDLMAALEASLAAVRSGDDGPAEAAASAQAAKPASAPKPPAKTALADGEAKADEVARQIQPEPRHAELTLGRPAVTLSAAPRPSVQAASSPLCTALAPPGATGLYDPANEHDACGIALVAKLWGEASHAVVEKALDALENLEHRGAEGADPNTGDGAGILLQIPDAFFRGAVSGVELPPPGRYGVGVCYLPDRRRAAAELEQLIEETIEAEGQRALWWRDVPVDDRTSARPRACRRRSSARCWSRPPTRSRTRTRSSASCT